MKQKVFAGDQLHEGEKCCCLCGATQWTPNDPFTPTGGVLGPNRANRGMRVCRGCIAHYAGDRDGWTACDVEITRRKQLLGTTETEPIKEAINIRIPAAGLRYVPVGDVTASSANVLEFKHEQDLTADDLAWKPRHDTLRADAQRLAHYEERCHAYATTQRDPHSPDGKAGEFEWVVRGVADVCMDRAISAPEPPEAPAYVNPNWPPADPNDP